MKNKFNKKLLISRMIWTLILLINIALFVFSYLKIEWLNLFHGYTIGLIFGLFSPIFYLLFSFLCIEKILRLKKKTFRFFRPSALKIAMLAIASVFLALCAIYIHDETIFDAYDSQIWITTFTAWWRQLTIVDGQINSLVVNSQHHGILLLFVFTLISWLTTIWTVMGISIFLIIFEIYLIFAPSSWIPHWLTHTFWTKTLVKIFLFFDKDSKIKVKKDKKDLSYQFEVNKKAQVFNHDDPFDTSGSDFSADTYGEEVGNLTEDMMYSGAGITEDPLKNSNDFTKTYDRSKKNHEIKANDLPFDDPF